MEWFGTLAKTFETFKTPSAKNQRFGTPSSQSLKVRNCVCNLPLKLSYNLCRIWKQYESSLNCHEPQTGSTLNFDKNQLHEVEYISVILSMI